MAGISVIVPVLNGAASLPATLASLEAERRSGLVGEIVVVDGGSTDASPDRAAEAGARIVSAPRGRGGQLAVGAGQARGDWLMFLHADTRLAPGWGEAVRDFIASGGEAGYFRFALDDDGPRAKRLERMVAWRNRVFALPYGDQGLLVSRAAYERIGGFRPLPLFEDVDIVRRLGRGNLRLLDARAVTSADKWRRGGYLRRSARNLFCLSLYLLGLPPAFIERIYR